MDLEELESIPGVGTKTAERLAELEDPQAALSNEDVATVARAPGISDGRAARIVRAAIRSRHGDTDSFLETPRAREIYESILSLLQQRAVTHYGKKRLETFYPSSAESRIFEVQEFAQRAMEHSISDEVLESLQNVEPLERPSDIRIRNRCLATNDADTYSTARSTVPELSVELVENTRDLAELARGYSTVIALDEEFAGIEIEGDVRIQPDALNNPEELVPERTLEYFGRNRTQILAAIEVHRRAALDSNLHIDELEHALFQLGEDGNIRNDQRIDQLETALSDLDTSVGMAENVANDHLRDAIEKRNVTIDGADLLSLVERGAGVESLLSRELADEHAEAITAAREYLIDAINYDDFSDIARHVFTEEPTFPVERNEQALERLRDEIRLERDQLSTSRKQDLAADLREYRDDVEAFVDAALELDVELAIARFGADFDCTFPTFESMGISITAGRSPLLDVPFGEVESVDYSVEGVTILSGVNSGGKTSTLDLIALIVILAQMGLPVPAESVTLQQFESLHYQAKTQGTLDAGAFESTLRAFESVVTDDRTQLVLVDELESITEPGASAVIIAGILESLVDQHSTAVFVSHLAGEIRDAADMEVSIDGIEAVGLRDGELEVNRSPVKDHLARSTPELIVEKLATESASNDTFYRRLLDKFEGESKHQ